MQAFIEYTTPRWRASKIHVAICAAFDRVVSGEVDRLLLLCPPQHGKSVIASKRAAAYMLGRDPTLEIICASATNPLAEEFGGAVRNCVNSAEYRRLFPATRLSEDTTAKGRWTTNEGGGYYAVGIGQALFGRGGMAIIDDPFATWEAAQSILEQKRVFDWYQGTLYNRVRPGQPIVVIQHRMHVNDLVGRLLAEQEKGSDRWTVVKLPAELDDPPWPERYDRAALERIKMNTSSQQWQGLYMQEPVAPGGGEFKRDWLEHYDELPDEVGTGTNRYILVDPASGRRKDKDNDYTSIWVVGLQSDLNYYVLDLVRDKLTLTERTRELMRLHRKWRPMQVRYEQYGMQSDIEHIKSVQKQENYRFSITEVGGAAVDKDNRIRRLIPLFERRRIYLPTTIHRTQYDGVTRNQIDQFIEEELLAFPGPRHDDALDALARIAEPDLPLVWPKSANDEPKPRPRYVSKPKSATVWAA
jgi:predicted phage terminase large subunit-like protein